MTTYLKPDLQNDKLLWEDKVTIYCHQSDYSTNIIRQYKNSSGQKYYVFFQLDSSNPFNYKYDNNELDIQETFCWGKNILNYTIVDYSELKKIIKFNDTTPIFEVHCTYDEFVSNTFEEIRRIPDEYRLDSKYKSF